MVDGKVEFGLGGAPGAGGESEPVIEFLCDPALAGRIPTPDRAIRFAPEWFRRLEREMGGVDAFGYPAMTVKACLPVTDAFALGFVIPLPFEVRLQVPEDRFRIGLSWAEGLPFRPIEYHHPAQIGGPHPPFEATMPLKFVNPWRIKVPPGYSALLTQPFNRPDLPFACFTGMVDCDRFDTTINFPFVWTGPPGEHVLPAGTPIAQVVPILRESLLKAHASRPSSEAELAKQAVAHHRKYHETSTYAREWRVKK